MADTRLVPLLLEAAKALFESGKLTVSEDGAVVQVPYLTVRPDGVVVKNGSLKLLRGRARP